MTLERIEERIKDLENATYLPIIELYEVKKGDLISKMAYADELRELRMLRDKEKKRISRNKADDRRWLNGGMENCI